MYAKFASHSPIPLDYLLFAFPLLHTVDPSGNPTSTSDAEGHHTDSELSSIDSGNSTPIRDADSPQLSFWGSSPIRLTDADWAELDRLFPQANDDTTVPGKDVAVEIQGRSVLQARPVTVVRPGCV